MGSSSASFLSVSSAAAELRSAASSQFVENTFVVGDGLGGGCWEKATGHPFEMAAGIHGDSNPRLIEVR